MRNATRACWTVGILGAGLSAWVLLRPRYDHVWNAREALPETVNSPGIEIYEPNFTPDGKSLVFTRGSAGKNTDLMSVPIRRDGTPTGTPTPLRGLATEFDEIDGMLGTDGFLYFYSDRPGGLGGYDLYSAKRLPDGSFETPVNLGPGVNSEFNDYDPCLSPDRKFLYFASNRHSAGSEEDYDLYVCLRTAEGWSKPRALAGLNTPTIEWEPMLARDGRTLYFNGNRPRPSADGNGTRTDFDLFAATLDRKAGWGNVSNLGPEVNSENDEFDPAIHPRSDALLFVRGVRDGEAYDVRIWRAAPRAIPLGPIIRVDRFPKAVLLALAALATLLVLLWVLIAGWRRLSTLQKCLLASLAAHCLVAWIFTILALTSRFEEFERSDSAFSVYTDIPEDVPQDVLLAALFQDTDKVEVSKAPQPDVATVPDPEPVRAEVPPSLAAPEPEPQAPARDTPLPELAPVELSESPPVEAEVANPVDAPVPEVRPTAAPAPVPPTEVPTAGYTVALRPDPAVRPTDAAPMPRAVTGSLPPTSFAVAERPAPQAAASPDSREAAPAPAAAPPPVPGASAALAGPNLPFDLPDASPATVEVHTPVRQMPSSRTQLAAVRFAPGAEDGQVPEALAVGSPAETVPAAVPAPPFPTSLSRAMAPAEGPAFAPPTFASMPGPSANPSPTASPSVRGGAVATKPVEWTPKASELAAAGAVAVMAGQGADPAPDAPSRPAPPAPSVAGGLPLPTPPVRVAYHPPAMLPGPAPTLGHAPRVAARERVSRIQWGTPTNLGATINRGGETYEPNLSADGRTLFFTHGPAGGEANLFRSERTAEGWKPPEPVEELNSEFDDIDATIDGLGRTVLFYSNRPEGLGGYDLYGSLMGDDGRWMPPTNLGSRVNSVWNDYDPHLSRDGKRLFFASNRQSYGSEDDYDLYLCEWEEGAGWSAPVRLPFNTAVNEWEPALSPDGFSLYFTSNRPGGRGGYDVWVSHFRNGQWQPPQPLDGAVNSEQDELDPAVSLDGETLYFVSNRKGSHGTFDIWQAKRRLVE